MGLPITLPIILLISIFSVYYDIKERRIPNWIIFYGFIFLTILYAYVTIFYEFSFLFYQLYYIFQLFLFLFITYLFMNVNPGDIKIFLLVSYAFPYFYIKYRIVEQIPFLSIFINFAILSLIYFFYSVDLKTYREKWKNILSTYLNLLVFLTIVITITFIVITNLRSLLIYSIVAGILLVMVIIRVISYFIKKFGKIANKFFYIAFPLCLIFLVINNFTYYLIVLSIILFITSIYISVKDDEKLKEKSIPLSVFIILAMLLTIILEGDLITFLRLNYSI